MIQHSNPINNFDIIPPRKRGNVRVRILATSQSNVVSSSNSFGTLFKRGFKMTAMTLVIMLSAVPFLSAYEAHIINVTAEIAFIEPPILTLPGAVDNNSLIGGTGLAGTVDVVMTDDDPDATYIFYTYGSGLNPSTIPDPVCGEPNDADGGGDLKTELIQLSLTSDTVIKAIACDGADGLAHESIINTKVYDFDVLCPPTDVVFPTNLAVLAAGDNPTNDDFIASANIIINGDLRSNNDITASGGGANRNINGNATASGAVSVANYIISGSTTQGAPTTTLPDVQIPTWQANAQAGGTVNGSFVFPNGTSGIELGPTEIMGNLVFNGSNSVTFAGPVYVHGNLVIEQNTTLTQDPALGNNFVTIIVDGTIDIDNNVNFVGNGSGDGSGAFLLISTAAAQAGDNAAIEISNDNSDLGDAVLYASNGDIHINANRVVLAVFATHGTSATNAAIDFESNVTVNYRELPDQIVCGEEIDTLNQLLINEFLPNPTGSDIDGEFVELYNGTNASIDVNNYVLYDNNDANELIISTANVVAGVTTVDPGERLVVYRDGDADFELNNSGGDTVRLYNAAIGLGILIDQKVYTYSPVPDNKSFSRVPDGTANWIDPDPTPGDPNLEFFSTNLRLTDPIVYENSEPEYSEPAMSVVTELEPEPEVESTETEPGPQSEPESQPEPEPESVPAPETIESTDPEQNSAVLPEEPVEEPEDAI